MMLIFEQSGAQLLTLYSATLVLAFLYAHGVF